MPSLSTSCFPVDQHFPTTNQEQHTLLCLNYQQQYVCLFSFNESGAIALCPAFSQTQ
jgi:hypothetical protein